MQRKDKPITIGPRYTLLGGTPWTIPNIGQSIDNMTLSYQQYINRKSLVEGKTAIHDFQLATKELITNSKQLYDFLLVRFPGASPGINLDLRASIDKSVQWNQFHARYLTFQQLTQHFSAREHLMTPEKIYDKIRLLYEIHRMAEELLELSQLIPLDEEPNNA